MSIDFGCTTTALSEARGKRQALERVDEVIDAVADTPSEVVVVAM